MDNSNEFAELNSAEEAREKVGRQLMSSAHEFWKGKHGGRQVNAVRRFYNEGLGYRLRKHNLLTKCFHTPRVVKIDDVSVLRKRKRSYKNTETSVRRLCVCCRLLGQRHTVRHMCSACGPGVFLCLETHGPDSSAPTCWQIWHTSRTIRKGIQQTTDVVAPTITSPAKDATTASSSSSSSSSSSTSASSSGPTIAGPAIAPTIVEAPPHGVVLAAVVSPAKVQSGGSSSPKPQAATVFTNDTTGVSADKWPGTKRQRLPSTVSVAAAGSVTEPSITAPPPSTITVTSASSSGVPSTVAIGVPLPATAATSINTVSGQPPPNSSNPQGQRS